MLGGVAIIPIQATAVTVVMVAMVAAMAATTIEAMVVLAADTTVAAATGMAAAGAIATGMAAIGMADAGAINSLHWRRHHAAVLRFPIARVMNSDARFWPKARVYAFPCGRLCIAAKVSGASFASANAASISAI